MFMRNENGSHGKNINFFIANRRGCYIGRFENKRKKGRVRRLRLKKTRVRSEDSDSKIDSISIRSDKPSSISQLDRGLVAGWMRLVRSALSWSLITEICSKREDSM